MSIMPSEDVPQPLQTGTGMEAVGGAGMSGQGLDSEVGPVFGCKYGRETPTTIRKTRITYRQTYAPIRIQIFTSSW